MEINDIPMDQRLTKEEKCFIDTLPQDDRDTLYNESEGKETAEVIGIVNDGVTTLILESPYRIQAAKLYIDMLRGLDEMDRSE